MHNMNFEKALSLLLNGRCIRRDVWAKTYCIILHNNMIHAYVHIPEQWKEVEKTTMDDRFFTYNDIMAKDWVEYEEFYKDNTDISDNIYGGCMNCRGFILYKTLKGKKFFWGGLRLPTKVTDYLTAEMFIHTFLDDKLIELGLFDPKKNWYEQYEDCDDERELTPELKEIFGPIIKENWLFKKEELKKLYV